jgi:hypothetical protein
MVAGGDMGCGGVLEAVNAAALGGAVPDDAAPNVGVAGGDAGVAAAVDGGVARLSTGEASAGREVGASGALAVAGAGLEGAGVEDAVSRGGVAAVAGAETVDGAAGAGAGGAWGRAVEAPPSLSMRSSTAFLSDCDCARFKISRRLWWSVFVCASADAVATIRNVAAESIARTFITGIPGSRLEI